MHYAPLDLFGVAAAGGFGAGQADLVHRAAASVAQEAPKGYAKLRGAGFVRYWLDSSRPSRAPQGHAGLAG